MERGGPVKRILPFALVLAACAVTPRLDLATLGAVAPEEKFVLTTDAKPVTVDHLRVGADSVCARSAPADDKAAPYDIAVPRASVTDLRRSYTGTPDVELVMVPVVLLLGVSLYFLHAMGGSGS